MRQAVALKRWLALQDPPLANEIFLDVDPDTGLRAGSRWKEALRQANARCEAVICLLSPRWEASDECRVEYRTAENLNKQIFVARLEPSTGDGLTSEWQRCDLFGAGAVTEVEVGGGAPVVFATEGLYRLRDAIRGAGIGAESFVWPPPSDPDRAPYRGWEPLEPCDAAVFFGRDAQIVRALDAVRGMRLSGLNSLFVVLGPSGTGKSSFLRAGLLPRLTREDRRFVVLDIVRPERNALTGQSGLAAAIHSARRRFGFTAPNLGEIKAACTGGDVTALTQWLTQVRAAAAARLVDRGDQAGAAPTLVLPVDQAEELFTAEAAGPAETFLQVLAGLVAALNTTEAGLTVAVTIRTDRYEVMQTHPALAEVDTVLFDELKPMPATQFKEVIVGPAMRATEAGTPLRVAPDLVERLLADAGAGADTLPMLALTMSRLYTDYGDDGELRLDQYEAMGGMARVVATEIDEILATDPAQRHTQLLALRAAFVPWLATINPDNDQPLRRVARYQDLPESSHPLIDAMVARRLMVKDTRDGQTVVEVALESLLRQWDDLAGWLADQRHHLKAADDIERAAAAWTHHDHDPAWLLAGTRLADAETLAHTPGFRERLHTVGDYLAASRDAENQRHAAEEQQRRIELDAARERAHNAQERQATAEAHSATLRKRSRILRAVLAATAIVAVLAVLGGLVAIRARTQAQDRFLQATSQRLTSQAQAMLADTSPGSDTRAFQQLLAARHLTPTPTNDSALYSATINKLTTTKIIEIPGGEPIFSVAVSPNGETLASGGLDDIVRLWDTATGEPLGDPLTGHELAVESLVFSPDGTTLATGSSDTTVRLWDTTTGQPLGNPLTGHTEGVGSVAFSPDGTTLASASYDNTVRLWDTTTGRPLGNPLTGHTEGVTSVAFSPDGTTLATGSGDTTVRLWDTTTGQPLGNPLTGHTGGINSVTFSPDGTRLATASVDDDIRVWSVDTGETIGEPLTGHWSSVIDVAFSPDGRRLVSGADDATVRLWNADTGQAIGAPLTGHESIVYAVTFTPDGERVVSSGRDGTVRMWDLAAGTPLTGHSDSVLSVAFSPAGDRLASASFDATVRTWDVETGQQVSTLVGHTGAVSTVAFSPDGTRIASGGLDSTVRIWDAETGRPLGAPLTGHTDEIASIAFSPDGTRLASGSFDDTIRFWDTETGVLEGEIEVPSGTAAISVAFSPDGRILASAGNVGTLLLWDTESYEAVRDPLDVPGDSAVGSVAFSPDGRRLAASSYDSLIRVWDVEDWRPAGEPLNGHQGLVRSVVFSPDGQRLASGGFDGTVRLWDVSTGQPFGDPLRGHDYPVVDVAFSPDGTLVASASYDTTVRLWPASATESQLCDKLTANMSHRQWRDWVSPDIDYRQTCPDLPIAPDPAGTQ
ncbi:translocation protein TolB [Mycobacterium sp. THAF192]|nr:translocation protein TolB [Mycobacterium sp. THAF192]